MNIIMICNRLLYQKKILFNIRSLGIIILLVIVINYINAFAKEGSIVFPDPYFPPNTSFLDEDNKKILLEQFEGKVVLLVFWASWSSTCENEILSLDILQKDFSKLSFEVVLLSQDYIAMEEVKKYLQSREIKYLKCYYDLHNQLFKDMRVSGIPTSYLIGSNGKVQIIFYGHTKWYSDDIRNIILSKVIIDDDFPKNSDYQRFLREVKKT